MTTQADVISAIQALSDQFPAPNIPSAACAVMTALFKEFPALPQDEITVQVNSDGILQITIIGGITETFLFSTTFPT